MADLLYVLIQKGRVQVILPLIVDLVICFFDLESNDGGDFPGHVESKRFFGANRTHEEVIEQVPLTMPWSLWLRMCDYPLVSKGAQQ